MTGHFLGIIPDSTSKRGEVSYRSHFSVYLRVLLKSRSHKRRYVIRGIKCTLFLEQINDKMEVTLQTEYHP